MLVIVHGEHVVRLTVRRYLGGVNARGWSRVENRGGSRRRRRGDWQNVSLVPAELGSPVLEPNLKNNCENFSLLKNYS